MQKDGKAHSVNANFHPMHALFPFTGFPFRKLRVFAYKPGITLAFSCGPSHLSGLHKPTQSEPMTADRVKRLT